MESIRAANSAQSERHREYLEYRQYQGCVNDQSDRGSQAGEAVVQRHESQHHSQPDDSGNDALGERVGAENGIDVALLNQHDRYGQSTAFQEECEVLYPLYGEVTLDDRRARRDRRADLGRDQFSAVKEDRRSGHGCPSKSP